MEQLINYYTFAVHVLDTEPLAVPFVMVCITVLCFFVAIWLQHKEINHWVNVNNRNWSRYIEANTRADLKEHELEVLNDAYEQLAAAHTAALKHEDVQTEMIEAMGGNLKVVREELLAVMKELKESKPITLTTLKQKCHVVEFSPYPPNSVGGWDWYAFRTSAESRVVELMDEETPYDVRYHVVEVEYDPDNEVITDRIADSGLLDAP